MQGTLDVRTGQGEGVNRDCDNVEIQVADGIPAAKNTDPVQVLQVQSRKATGEDAPDKDDTPSPNMIDPAEDLKEFPTWGIFPVVFGELSELSG